jgi:FtsH-binding integral membrane protein
MEEEQNNITKITQQGREIKQEVREKTLTYIIAALGLVAGLAWNEAIKALIEYFFPINQNNIWMKFGYAILITVLVVALSFYLTKAIKREKK